MIQSISSHTVLNNTHMHIAEKIPNHQLSFIWRHNLMENINLASFTMWFEIIFANKMCMNRMEYPNSLVGLVFWQIWNRIDFLDLAMLHRLWKESYQKLVFLHNLEWQMEATFSLCRFWFTTKQQTSNKDCSFQKNSKSMPPCYKTHFCWNIVTAGINQIATLCYHQYKLNGANLKDGAMNIIPLNIRKPN